MDPVSRSVDSFLSALKSGDAIVITADGNWYKKGIFKRTTDAFRGVFCSYNPALENAENLAASIFSTAKVCSDTIHGISQSAVWNPEDLKKVITAVKGTIQKKADEEGRQILSLVREQKSSCSETAIVELNRKIGSPELWAHRSASANLDRAYLMHQYLGMDQGAIDSTVTRPEDEVWMKEQLLLWQKERFPHVEYLVEEKNGLLSNMIEGCKTFEAFSSRQPPGTDKRALRQVFLKWKRNETILKKIYRCCRYPEFIKAARENRALLDQCFQTVFKSMPDECVQAIDIFLQAPQVQEQLR
jgi:hypothetical protein